jgi:ligand-binding sensor domain-containing protein
VYLARVGLGVTRVALRANSETLTYRTHDLALQRRPLSLATDARGNVWLVSEDGGAVRYDGTSFSRVLLDDDPQLHPLMFWTRGRSGAAVARVGDANVLRAYRLEGNAWRRVADGPVETYGPGTVDVKFLACDERGRFWVGLRVLDGARVRELGVAVLDPQNPVAVQYNSNIPATGGENGSRRAPDDITAVDFDREGNAWFAGLDGATRIRADGQEVRRFQEADGLRGDLVSDLVRATNDRLFFATPEGLGLYDGQAFNFAIEGSSSLPHVTGLAVDATGNLWGAGPRGAWRYDGRGFVRVGRAEGLPSEEFSDIAIDARNRVWFVTQEGLLLFDQSVRANR